MYARSATTEARESIPEQTNRCREFARLNGRVVADEDVYTDCGVSGVSIENRPALARLLQKSSRERLHVVLVTSPDRLTRSSAQLEEISRNLNARDTRVIFVDECDAVPHGRAWEGLDRQ